MRQVTGSGPRRVILSLLFVLLLFSPALRAAEAIRSFDLALRALVYDPFTAKIYATSPAGLLQIDPNSGEVLRTFPLGANLSTLELGAEHGLWIGLDGPSTGVQRFNLNTLQAEEPIVTGSDSKIVDISASRFDPYTLVLTSLPARAQFIRNGTVLPVEQSLLHAVLQGEFVIGQGTQGNIYKYPIDSFGIGNALPGIGMSTPVSLTRGDDAVYTGRGSYWPAPYFAGAQGGLPSSFWSAGAAAINPDTKEVLYVAWTDENRLDLNRYDSNHRQTGNYSLLNLPLVNPTDLSLATWSSNRAAFHTLSNFYLIDLDQAFLPGDLGVSGQVVSSTNITFGDSITLTMTVTNHGPGTVFDAILTNSLPEGTVISLLSLEDQPRAKTVPIMRPGDTAEFSITVTPAIPGLFIDQANVTARNEVNPANNSAQFIYSVLLPNPRLLSIPITAYDMAFEPSSGRFFYFAGLQLAAIDPAGPRILPPLRFPFASAIALDAGGGSLVLGYERATNQFGTAYATTFRVDPFALTAKPLGGEYIGAIKDLKISPRDPSLLVTSDSFGTYVLSSNSFGRADPSFGLVGFSDDGEFLYRVDETCSLDVFTVADTGAFAFQKRVTNLACGEFTVVGNSLLFDSGTIYNPATGERRSTGIAPPAFVLRSPAGNLDVLRRVQGQWALTRLDPATFQPTATNVISELQQIQGAILDATSAGENRIALRTISNIYILETSGAFGGLRATRLSPAELQLEFRGAAGRRYRLERSPALAPATWSPLGSEILGNGFTTRQILTTTEPSRAFYRVAELPN